MPYRDCPLCAAVVSRYQEFSQADWSAAMKDFTNEGFHYKGFRQNTSGMKDFTNEGFHYEGFRQNL